VIFDRLLQWPVLVIDWFDSRNLDLQTRNQLLQIFRVNRELASDVAHGVVEEQAED